MKLARGGLLVCIAVLAMTPGAAGASPAGWKVAYVRGGAGAPQVWVASAGGAQPRHLGPGTAPLISPSGAIIAASRVGSHGSALTLYRTAGRVSRRFFHISVATATALAWSPDSRYLVVALASTDPGSARPSGLAVIDTRTLGYRVIAHGAIYGASFASDGTDRIAYASARSLALRGRIDIHVVRADGTHRRSLTHDGHSLNPVWGPRTIAFDREHLRSKHAPAYEIWTMRADGSHQVRLTHRRVPALMNGFVPVGFSADGSRLLAEYEGQDTSQAWTLTIASRRLRKVLVHGHSVVGAAISRNGASVLVDRGGFLAPPNDGRVDTLPFYGGRPHLLAHGSAPSWNH